VQTYTLNAATGGIPTYPGILSAPPPLNRTPDIFVFAPNYVQPLTHQWSFNLEFQLARDYGITLGYLGVRGEHLTQTRDINLFPEVNFRHPGVGGPARPNSAFGRISLFDSNADSIYHGGFVQLTKRLGHGVALQTSYTFSKALDDAPDFTSVVVGTDDAKNARDTLRPGLDRGRANADVRHRFVFAGIWDIGYAHGLQNGFVRALLSGYQLSTIAQLQSGRAFTQTAGSDINNDGNTRTDRPLFVGRNTIDGPGFASVDLRFTRDFGFREKARLRLIFEAFNLTNRANYSAILTVPGPTYLTPTATLDPRILQLAAKFTF
ncbi:MAG: hypothetical protein M3Y27_06205, partial [Acidobacteriota bacterium]|nr:hypothetical protein [Acidobacteriota bacterium]